MAGRCDLCAAPRADDHAHLAEPARRSVACVCQDCARLFPAEAGGRFRRIPEQVRALPADAFEAEGWQALGVPIGLAWFTRNDDGRSTANYPSPVGTAQSALDAEAEAILARVPAWSSLLPEVEAVLVHRVQARPEAWCVPIDLCYRLVGSLRMQWEGITGGAGAGRAVEEFLERVRRQAGARA